MKLQEGGQQMPVPRLTMKNLGSEILMRTTYFNVIGKKRKVSGINTERK